MEMKDTIQLERWLAGRASLQDVMSVERFGLLDNERFTEQARRAYILAWEWSAPRFSGRIGWRQEMLFKRHGQAFLQRRYDRCNRMIAKFLGRES